MGKRSYHSRSKSKSYCGRTKPPLTETMEEGLTEEDKQEDKDNTTREKMTLELEGQPEVSKMLANKNTRDNMENKDNIVREKWKLELEE